LPVIRHSLDPNQHTAHALHFRLGGIQASRYLDGTGIAVVDAQRSALMPAISGSIFRRTLREQHRARSTKRALSPMWGRWCRCVSVLFTLPYFLLLSILSFTRETYSLWDSSVQYNSLVARTSLRRTNGHLPAHGWVCEHSMRCVSSAPFFPTSIRTSFLISLRF
jgi:hypothetical protein